MYKYHSSGMVLRSLIEETSRHSPACYLGHFSEQREHLRCSSASWNPTMVQTRWWKPWIANRITRCRVFRSGPFQSSFCKAFVSKNCGVMSAILSSQHLVQFLGTSVCGTRLSGTAEGKSSVIPYARSTLLRKI